MNNILNYQILKNIHEDSYQNIHKVKSILNEKEYIIKTFKKVVLGDMNFYKLKDDFNILKNNKMKGVLEPYFLSSYDGVPFVIYENYQGELLRNIINEGKLDLETFFMVSSKLVDILIEFEDIDFINKNLRPENIMINMEEKTVKLILESSKDFCEEGDLQEEMILENSSFQYISPEQTGRINIDVDLRCDFYLLGIIFYEMLTGQVPFNTEDLVVLLHCHIAKEPIKPKEICNEIPEMVSKIIMKLLSKNPEDRYNKAFGLKWDINKCYNEWREFQFISCFELGEKDIIDKFNISNKFGLSNKLYGREKELKGILSFIENNIKSNNTNLKSMNKHNMLIVSGQAGVGKSTIVNKFKKDVHYSGGYFISGKFEQYNKVSQYKAFIECFNDLINQILMESEEELNIWRNSFLDVLGINVQVIVEIIPSLELIVGKQPQIPKLEGKEFKNRFNIVFKNIVRVLEKVNRPIVLFLDDLQWANHNGLNFLNIVIKYFNNYICVISSHRIYEYDENLDIIKRIEEFEKNEIKVKDLRINSLNLENINEFILNTFNCSVEKSISLANHIMCKTKGNPLFVKEYLKSLIEENVIGFNDERKEWQWDKYEMEKLELSDTFLKLMIFKITKLPLDLQKDLKCISCIENIFNLKTVALIINKSIEKAKIQIDLLIEQGLILQVNNKNYIEKYSNNIVYNAEFCMYYKFFHDKIQQSIYDNILQDEKQKLHFDIGNLLLKNSSNSEIEELLFIIVNNLNTGKKYIDSFEKKLELIKLNLKAGKKAKKNVDYELYRNYYLEALSVYNSLDCEVEYKLIYDLYMNYAECEIINRNYDIADKIYHYLLDKSNNKIDRAKVYCKLIRFYTLIENDEKAFEYGKICLKMFNNDIKFNITKLEIAEKIKYIYKLIGEREIHELVELPIMVDEEKKAIMDVLSSLLDSSLYCLTKKTGKNTLNLLLCEIVRISLESGNTAGSSEGYAYFGLILAVEFEKCEEAYLFGKLACNLVDKYNIVEYKARVYYLFGNCINYFKNSLKSNIEILNKATNAALFVGDVDTARYSITQTLNTVIMTGNLEEVYTIAKSTYELLLNIKDKDMIDLVICMQNLILKFKGNPIELDDYSIGKVKDPIKLCLYGVLKIQYDYIHGDYEKALELCEKIKKEKWVFYGSKHQIIFYFYDSLILTALCSIYPENKDEYLKVVNKNKRILLKWVNKSPHNFNNQYLIVQGEIARVKGDFVKAIKLYEEAIEDAKCNNFMQNIAIAYELLYKISLEYGLYTLAKVYIEHSIEYYEKWGALEKVKVLKSEITRQFSKDINNEESSTKLPSLLEDVTNKRIDIESVIKATQTISSEMILEKLFEKLLKIAMENAGAQKGFFIVEEQGELLIKTEWEVSKQQIPSRNNLKIYDSSGLCYSIINYVWRTSDYVVYDETQNESIFASDYYIFNKKPKSILCTPISYAGKVKGILYLENNLTTSAFTKKRVEILEILLTQAAISIENASMYKEINLLNDKLNYKIKENDKLLQEIMENDKMKTEFFANISHELRTPLNVILAIIQVLNLRFEELFTETIQNKEKVKKYINTIKQNCYRLLRLVNNLIDITKIDSGYLQMNSKNLNIVSIIEDITLSVVEYIENKGIDLIFDTDCEDIVIACDVDKIERIVLNLISNAVKFTEDGGKILVSVENNEKYVVISVKDTGIGIPKEKQDLIFKRFIQVDKSLARLREGSGIGLSLVKSLVEMHEGKISLESEYGKGSEFRIELPKILVDEDGSSNVNNCIMPGNAEKIQLEFSDIYL